jgi:hypothetical protein
VFAVLALTVPVTGQECGNVDGNSQIDVADLSYLVAYLGPGGPGPNAQMDMDDRMGIALGDVVKLTDYLFIEYPTKSFDCSPSLTYSFAPSPDDTIFVPRLLSVPDGIDLLQLPIRISLQPGAGGVMAYMRQAEGYAGGFTCEAVRRVSVPGTLAMGVFRNGDKAFPTIMVWRENLSEGLAGNHQHFTLEYGRVTSGSTGADLVIEAFSIDQYMRVCVERNGDLLTPTVVYYDFQLPPDTLKGSAASLAFTTPAGKVARDTFAVTFTSTGSQVSFDLAASQPWIQLLDLPGGSLTTPLTIRVAVDGTTLPEGNYSGSIDITNATSILGVEIPQPSIDVDVAVSPPINFPPGDLTCDGVVDISDLSLMIAYLLRTVGSLPICY